MSRMNDILRDSKGFLWFASSQGLTRFDGYEFRTFGLEDGLPTKVITVLMQDHDGTYWLGTNKGLCHFDGSKFTLYAGSYVTALLQDKRGRIWCGTLNGLSLPKQLLESPVTAMAEDNSGAVWVSTEAALYKLEDGKPRVAYTAKDGIPGRMSCLLSDQRGRLWLGTWGGLCLLNTGNARGPIVQRKWTTADGLSSNIIHGLLRSSGGVIWALTEHGLSSWQEALDEPTFRLHHDAQGWLKGRDELAAEDRNGSLWIGTETHGVIRASLNGLTTFGAAEGLISDKIRDLFADKNGDTLAVTRIDSPDAVLGGRYRGQIIYRLSDDGLRAVNPAYPRSLKKPGWGERQIVLQDHLGEWWITSEQGLFRFPAVPLEKLSETAPTARYTAADGLGSNDMYRLHEDARGDIWVGVMGGGGAFRWQRHEQHFERVGSLVDSASVFADDNAGNVWLGWFNRGKLGRFRHGQLQTFDMTGSVTDIFKDQLGRIWVTTTRGLSCIDNPCDEVPKIQNYADVTAFSGHRLYCITEDKSGVLYVGSDNGLEAFNPATGGVRHFGMKDGLPADEVMSAYCDRRGVLWFGTHGGLVRLEPARRRARANIPLRIVGLQIGGQPFSVTKLGETQIESLRLNPGENVLQIDYTDLGFGAAGELRFQYLLGSGAGWSPASKDRTLHFAGLAPGAYKLSIRAVDVLGQPVSDPVTATFRVMPQFWQTWWFQVLCLAVAATVGVVIHRYRVSRLIAVQKLRSRIALDLHDEVGSGLTQIAIWSELARRNSRQESDAQLEQIAVSSRSLIDTIGDIVWTVNPRRDSVRELVQRVRYFATEICTSSDIDLHFEAASGELDGEANSEIRRDVFLIAKEALHNALKHASCSRIDVRFLILADILELEVADNGRGIATGGTEGNGLASMRQRAKALQGTIQFLAGEEGGTRVRLRMPLKRMRRKLPVSIAALRR